MPLKSSISSHVRISYRFYEFVTTRYTADFYIIRTISQRHFIYSIKNNTKKRIFVRKNIKVSIRPTGFL